MDNTLFNQVDYIKNLMGHLAFRLSKKYQLSKKTTAKLLLSYWMEKGPFYGHFFDDIAEKLLIDKKEVNELIAITHSYKPAIDAYPGALPVLDELQKKYRLALITDGNENVQRNKIAALGLKEYFTNIFYATGKNMKPNPKGYTTILSHLKLQPNEALYVGDNPHVDFITPNDIGMPCARVMTGYFKDVKMDKGREAKYKIRSLKEIFEVLNKLERE